jgi:chorismate-pyruvate lyase
VSHMRRIVIEEVEPCHHGKMYSHRWAWSGWCPGSTTLARTVLTEPSEEMVERAATTIHELRCEQKGPTDADVARAALTAALFSSDVGEREET